MRCTSLRTGLALVMATLMTANTFAQPAATPGQDDVTPAEIEAAQHRVAELEAQQRELVEEARKLTSERREQARASNDPESAEKARAMARLEADIEKSIDRYMRGKKFLGPKATEYRFAKYLEDWRLKVERVAAANYPAAARGKIYGTVILSVEIKSDGSLASAPEINRSSGHKILDDAAVMIARRASPYAPFPPEIKEDTDIIVITRGWSFGPGNQSSSPSQKIQPPTP